MIVESGGYKGKVSEGGRKRKTNVLKRKKRSEQRKGTNE